MVWGTHDTVSQVGGLSFHVAKSQTGVNQTDDVPVSLTGGAEGSGDLCLSDDLS